MSLQGIESIAIHGRYGDNMIGHLTPGEMVLPKPIADDPILKRELFNAFERHEINPYQYTVGHFENSINPLTGVPEFGFFKKIGKFLRKAAPIIGQAVGFAIGGPQGAAIGGGIGSAIQGGDIGDIAKSAALGFAGGHIAQGMGVQGNLGLSEGIGSLNPFGGDFMLSKANMIGPTQSVPGSGVGGFFQDIGAKGAQALGMQSPYPVGSPGMGVSEGFKLGDAWKGLSTLQKVGVAGTGLTALGGFQGDDSRAELPAPSGESEGYLQNPLRPATLPTQYGMEDVGAAGTSLTGLGSTGALDKLDPATAAYLKSALTDDDYSKLLYPEFERVDVKGGGAIRLADGRALPELDLRNKGGDISDPEGSGDIDTVNAKLADGEFVLTKQSVQGIGDGDHSLGIEKLYDFMNFNENRALEMGLGRA